MALVIGMLGISGPIFVLGFITGMLASTHRLKCMALNLSFPITLAAIAIIDVVPERRGLDVNEMIQQQRSTNVHIEPQK